MAKKFGFSREASGFVSVYNAPKWNREHEFIGVIQRQRDGWLVVKDGAVVGVYPTRSEAALALADAEGWK